jgi:hypothetical protein
MSMSARLCAQPIFPLPEGALPNKGRFDLIYWASDNSTQKVA